MKFSTKKLSPDVAKKLRRCPIEAVEPYALICAPIYVQFKKNEKYLAIKEPLDFFEPEELKRFRPLRNFYVTEFVDRVEPFRKAGRSVRALINLPDPEKKKGDKSPYPEIPLPIAPFELSDAAVRILGPLWSPHGRVEPFFLCLLVEELCQPLPIELLVESRNESVVDYETALLCSSWAVFLALHVGFCKQGVIDRVRRRVFEEVIRGQKLTSIDNEIDELIHLAKQTLPNPDIARLEPKIFEDRQERTAQKLRSRLRRIERQFVHEGLQDPTIFGEEGFLNG